MFAKSFVGQSFSSRLCPPALNILNYMRHCWLRSKRLSAPFPVLEGFAHTHTLITRTHTHTHTHTRASHGGRRCNQKIQLPCSHIFTNMSYVLSVSQHAKNMPHNVSHQLCRGLRRTRSKPEVLVMVFLRMFLSQGSCILGHSRLSRLLMVTRSTENDQELHVYFLHLSASFHARQWQASVLPEHVGLPGRKGTEANCQPSSAHLRCQMVPSFVATHATLHYLTVQAMAQQLHPTGSTGSSSGG